VSQLVSAQLFVASFPGINRWRLILLKPFVYKRMRNCFQNQVKVSLDVCLLAF
jgi:hypothetical protein